MLVQFGMCLNIGRGIDRFADLGQQGAAVAEEVAVLQSDRNNPDRTVAAGGLIGSQRDAGHPLADGEQSVHRAVRSLRHDAEVAAAGEHLDGFFDGLLRFIHILQAVATTVDRHDFQVVQDRGDLRIPEDVGPGHEHLPPAAHRQHGKRIHQGVAVVGGVDDGSLRGNLLQTEIADPAVGASDEGIRPEAEKRVAQGLFVDFLAHT